MITINAYKQYFTITSINFSKLIMMLREYNKKLVTHRMALEKRKHNRPAKTISIVDKEFYLIDEINNVVRYPITILDDLIDYLFTLGHSKEEIDIINHDHFIGVDDDIGFNKKITLREYQEKYIEAITTWQKNNILIDLQTGRGKTVIASNAISKMKKKFSIIVLPRFIDKWISDVMFLNNLSKDEIMVIQGSDNLLGLLHTPKEDLEKYKVYIFSLTTISKFIKSYLEGQYKGITDKTPSDIFEHIGTEIVLNDEAHMEMHNVFYLMLFSNIRLLLALSATLISNDGETRRMQEIMYPTEQRISNIIEYHRYIIIYSVRYRFFSPRRIRFKNQYGYNQAVFEASIRRHSVTLKNYLTMIYNISIAGYKTKRKEGHKLLMFFGTVEMCTIARDFFRERYPDLIVNRYTQEEPYEILKDTDIICSTMNSLGVAIDIPKLKTVIQTVNVDSPSSNIQALGRLRDIGEDVFFYYLWSNDIPQHKRYNKNRINLFRPKSKEIRLLDYKHKI